MNGYVGYYHKQRAEVHADTTYEAQQKLAVLLKARYPRDIYVILAEKNGVPIVHVATE